MANACIDHISNGTQPRCAVRAIVSDRHITTRGPRCPRGTRTRLRATTPDSHEAPSRLENIRIVASGTVSIESGGNASRIVPDARAAAKRSAIQETRRSATAIRMRPCPSPAARVERTSGSAAAPAAPASTSACCAARRSRTGYWNSTYRPVCPWSVRRSSAGRVGWHDCDTKKDTDSPRNGLLSTATGSPPTGRLRLTSSIRISSRRGLSQSAVTMS
jgi:hypothetical protein